MENPGHHACVHNRCACVISYISLCAITAKSSLGSMGDYDLFDPSSYIACRYADLSREDRVLFQLNHLHTLFQSLPAVDGGMTVVDFGCGPIVQHSISAVGHASELVFADIASSNRAYIKQWLEKEPGAFDWSPHFDYVVKTLEGGEERDAREREERMRHVTKGVVWCDYFGKEGIIEKGYEGPYDVVLESNSLQAACTSVESYKQCVKLLAGLLKPGGTLAMYGEDTSMETTTLPYMVSDKEFSVLCLSRECIRSILIELGFVDVKVDFISKDASKRPILFNLHKGMNGYYFISAKTKLFS